MLGDRIAGEGSKETVDPILLDLKHISQTIHFLINLRPCGHVCERDHKCVTDQFKLNSEKYLTSR